MDALDAQTGQLGCFLLDEDIDSDAYEEGWGEVKEGAKDRTERSAYNFGLEEFKVAE